MLPTSPDVASHVNWQNKELKPKWTQKSIFGALQAARQTQAKGRKANEGQ